MFASLLSGRKYEFGGFLKKKVDLQETGAKALPFSKENNLMARYSARAATSIFVILITASAASAIGKQRTQDPPSEQQVDSFIEQGMAKMDIPGAAVALIKNGKITHVRGFGVTGDSGIPVTAHTPFQIASMTKSFTSLVVLQLAEEKRLSIDDPVVKYIPHFHTSDDEVSDRITIRQLMDHRSGISTLDGNRYQRTTYRGKDATERAVRNLSSARLRDSPGERFHYSNANYATLAHLIETIEQAPFEEVLKARIFSRLGMANTYVQVPSKAVEPEAKGHLQWFGIPVEDHFVAGRMMMGAGGITTSAEDLAKYMISVSQADPRIVPAALAKSWAQQSVTPYEFGWEHNSFGGKSVIFHGGENPGFRSVMMYTPENGRGGLFLMNASGTLGGNLPDGTIRYALGLPPISIAPSGVFVMLLWGSLASMLGLMIACVFSIFRLHKNASKPWDRSKPAKWAFIILPSLGFIAFAFSMLFYVPRSFGVNFAAASLFNPDLGLLLFSMAAIATVWAGIRTERLIRRYRI